ncbi:gliding motility-associated C-terminal domain-containing protein [Taibaiella koreensis]|uniref:gliding motility-associated C-terminal domain-containing protein n=1 Tax=Taibaiella koreensis TaxID=1268548 RepID=UPI0013C357C0|nr:gliding motility-associated C-terminal domain-containing protein [Taibaiella koreensis]
MKLSFLLACLLLPAAIASAQNITNGDGTPLTRQYCYADGDFEIAGLPAGGTFSGCGVTQHAGRWYFNPLTATAGISVFPYQCNLSYTVNGQSVTRSILVQKPVKIDPPLQDITTCDGNFLLEAKMLYAGAYHYRWEPAVHLEQPDTSVTAGHIEHTETFVIMATDQVGNCSGSDTVTVSKRPSPDVLVAPQEKTIVSRQAVQLRASGAGHYSWPGAAWLSDDRISDPIAKPQAPVTYMVVGWNEYGCSDTARVVILIADRLFVPNAFSPNGDGQNDVFRIENFGYQRVEEFRVFNRWGQQVYATQDGTKGWDGSYNGGYADPGTYFYMIRVRMPGDEVMQLKGDVVLVR